MLNKRFLGGNPVLFNYVFVALRLSLLICGCMLSMYMRDAVTMLDIPGGGNKVVKEF